MPHSALNSSDNGPGIVLMAIECESAIVMPTADSQAFEELGLDEQPGSRISLDAPKEQQRGLQ